MAKFAGGKIKAFAGPRELGARDDLCAVIVNFIDGAREALFIAVQEVGSEPIAQAVIDARWRGVEVKMIVEQDYLASDKIPKATAQAGETPAQAARRVQWEEYRRPKTAKTNRDILSPGFFNFHLRFIFRDRRRLGHPAGGGPGNSRGV
jgi:hypothetical protein